MILAIAQAEAIHFGRELSHRLDRMMAALPESNPKSALKTVAWLEAYATTYRYPKTSGAITPLLDRAKLEGALAELRRVLRELADYFAVDLSPGATGPAANIHPPRKQAREAPGLR
jgi:hypothetical protein